MSTEWKGRHTLPPVTSVGTTKCPNVGLPWQDERNPSIKLLLRDKIALDCMNLCTARESPEVMPFGMRFAGEDALWMVQIERCNHV